MTAVLPLLAQFRPERFDHRGGSLLAVVLVPLIVALVAFGIYQLVRGARDTAATGVVAAVPSSARSILDERFARGEIDSATYLHQVETLRIADTWVSTPADPDEVEES